MITSSREAAGEWRRHGTMLLPCLAGIILVSVHGYSMGVMMAPLHREFGWSRAEISSGIMIVSFVSFLLSPFVGMMIDRLGPRRIAIAGVILYSLMVASFSTLSGGVVSWWLRWGALGVASSMILPTVWMTAINSVFDVNRGKALAIALLGTGISAAFVPSLANALTGLFGWRGTYVALGGILGGIAAILVLVFFHSAADERGAKRQAVAGAEITGMRMGEGLRSPAFLKIAAAILIFAITSLALSVNAVPMLEARGFDRTVAAGVAGLLGIGSIIGRLGGGYLLDRLDARRVAAVSVFAPVISSILLLTVPESTAVASIAMLILGLALGAEVDSCSYLAARHFGMRSFGSLFGCLIGVTVFGTGVGPVIANHIYDVTGSYDPVLMASVPACILSSLLFLTLGTYPSAPGEGSGAVTLAVGDNSETMRKNDGHVVV